MEPHYGKPQDYEAYSQDWSSIEEVFELALDYVRTYHASSFFHYRDIKLGDLKPWNFWSEYVWTVYASGFNAKVLTPKFQQIMKIVGSWDAPQIWDIMWIRLSTVIANKRKANAVAKCRDLMCRLGWDEFREKYCGSAEALKALPFIGGITCFHLARNIGIDCVKPDLHLMRLANHFQFESPETMCDFLSELFEERVGVVDFVLWAYCAAFGTLEIR